MPHSTYSPSEIASLREDSEDREPVTVRKTKYFSLSATSNLSGMCRVAAERYKEYAEQLDAVAAQGGNAFMTADAAKFGAEQMRSQEKEALEFLHVFASADDFEVEYEEEV